jgi:hypothetical protein
MSDLAKDLLREHRPRKKKKPKGMSKGLLIGLIAGGSGLLIGAIVLIVVLAGKGPDVGKKPDDGPKKIDPKDYVRPMAEKDALAKLQKIGEAYHKFIAEAPGGKGPASAAELSKLLDAEQRGMIDPKTGWIEMFYNWTPTLLPDGKARTIVAEEKIPYKGTRVVLFGDNSVKVVSDEELAKAPRAPGAKAFEAGPLVLEGGKTRLGKHVRGIALAQTRQTLHNIGQCYLAYEIEKNRGPKELADLDCARDALVQGALDPKEGWLEFFWGVGQRNMADPPRTILAFEREPVDGMRYVIFGNGTWDRITDEDFAKAPKAKK